MSNCRQIESITFFRKRRDFCRLLGAGLHSELLHYTVEVKDGLWCDDQEKIQAK